MGSPGPTVPEFGLRGIAGRFLSLSGVAIPTEKHQGAWWKRGGTCFTSRASRCFLSSLRIASTEFIITFFSTGLSGFPPPTCQFTTGVTSFFCVLVAQSCPTLCNPMDCSPPASSVRGILQARNTGLPFPSPGYLSNPGIEQRFLHCRQMLYHLSYLLLVEKKAFKNNLKTIAGTCIQGLLL